MEEFLSNYDLHDIFIAGFFIGVLFNIVQDLIFSLIDYLQNKSWLIKDYEKIIYEYICTSDVVDDQEKEIIAIARNNYNKHLVIVKRRNDIFNKLFKKKSKEKNE